MANGIDRYFGTYRGLSPTDESKIALGEVECTINEDGLTIRHATGLRIVSESITLELVRPLSETELRMQFQSESNAHTLIDGFRIDDGATLLFVREPEENEPRLIVRLGEFIEALGITMLFDEEQTKRGLFDMVVNKLTIEMNDPYPFPRLMYEGKHEPQVS